MSTEKPNTQSTITNNGSGATLSIRNAKSVSKKSKPVINVRAVIKFSSSSLLSFCFFHFCSLGFAMRSWCIFYLFPYFLLLLLLGSSVFFCIWDFTVATFYFVRDASSNNELHHFQFSSAHIIRFLCTMVQQFWPNFLFRFVFIITFFYCIKIMIYLWMANVFFPSLFIDFFVTENYGFYDFVAQLNKFSIVVVVVVCWMNYTIIRNCLKCTLEWIGVFES